MSAPIRFHLDESVDPGVARGLAQRGIDASTARDVGLLSANDEQQLAFSLQEGRVLVTHDRDFIGLHNAGVDHAGIVYSPHERHSIGQMIEYLAIFHECLEATELAGRLEYF